MNEWKTKRGEEIVSINIADMEEEHLQKAYAVVERRQINLFNSINTNRKLKKAIEKEAKKRKMELQSIADTATGKLKKEVEKKQSLVLALNNSIARKERAILNGKA